MDFIEYERDKIRTGYQSGGIILLFEKDSKVTIVDSNKKKYDEDLEEKGLDGFIPLRAYFGINSMKVLELVESNKLPDISIDKFIEGLEKVILTNY